MPADHVHSDAQAAIDAVLATNPGILQSIQPRDPNQPEPHWRDITGADTALGSAPVRAQEPRCSHCGQREADHVDGRCSGYRSAPTGRAQGPDDLTDRLAGRLADALGRLREVPWSGNWTAVFPSTDVQRWRALLGEHADRSLTAGWHREADQPDPEQAATVRGAAQTETAASRLKARSTPVSRSAR